MGVYTCDYLQLLPKTNQSQDKNAEVGNYIWESADLACFDIVAFS